MRKGYYRDLGEDAVIMWAHDIDSDEYLRRLDIIREGLNSEFGPPEGEKFGPPVGGKGPAAQQRVGGTTPGVPCRGGWRE